LVLAFTAFSLVRKTVANFETDEETFFTSDPAFSRDFTSDPAFLRLLEELTAPITLEIVLRIVSMETLALGFLVGKQVVVPPGAAVTLTLSAALVVTLIVVAASVMVVGMGVVVNVVVVVVVVVVVAVVVVVGHPVYTIPVALQHFRATQS